MNKDVKQVVDVLVDKLGFELAGMTGTGHYRLVHPNGPMTIPCSPSDGRWQQNSLRQAEQISGRKLPRKKSGRPSRGKSGSGYSVKRTAAEADASRRSDEYRIRIQQTDSRLRALYESGRRVNPAEALALLDERNQIASNLAGLHQPVPKLEIGGACYDSDACC